jgi:2-polyprenyl-3-methyl-5-hydroxy-6-metoxy-1,4-benzoquinol methylase
VAGLDAHRAPMYERYASTHAGLDDRASPHVLRRDVLRHLHFADRAGLVVDLGCGQGDLVRFLIGEGFAMTVGVDASPEQVEIATLHGSESVSRSSAVEALCNRQGVVSAITALDFLEHLNRAELLETVQLASGALVANGVLVARVPNASSPFGGNLRHGDMTHESSFTSRSIRQLIALTGFSSVDIYPCPPLAHGPVSLLRGFVWRAFSGFIKLALAAETGSFDHVVTQNLVFVAHKDG